MDGEAKLQQYLLLGKSAKGRALVELINTATAEPGLFAFGELLALPSVQEVNNVQSSHWQAPDARSAL